MGLIGKGPTTRDEVVVTSILVAIGLVVSALAVGSGDVAWGCFFAALTGIGLLELIEDRWPKVLTKSRRRVAFWSLCSAMVIGGVFMLLQNA